MNASKENTPADNSYLANRIAKEVTKRTTRRPKQEPHDDFGDLLDYMMLDSSERAKHRADFGRANPVVQKVVEGDLIGENPTIAELNGIQIS